MNKDRLVKVLVQLKETEPPQYKKYMQALDGEMRRGNQMAKQILEEVIEESARKRSSYEGLNEWM